MPNYDDLHRANILRYSNQIDAAYQRVIDQFARISSDPSARFSSAFTFKNEYINSAGKLVPNDRLSTLADKYTSQFAKEVEQIVSQGIEAEWSLSNEKNNALVQQHITNTNILKVNPALAEGYSIDAIRAFAQRQIEGIGLSSRVWDIAQQFKMEMEAHLAIGIANGDSAQVISKRVRQYLKEPDKLFRRIRNEAGDLIPSSRMKEFKPGQGVYKSSYKNAMRIARTETNTAYLNADHQRWNDIDFIVGVKVSLSNRHPVYDICDDLKGDYPKEFRFTGWHPQCLCTATPIMLNDEEFDEYEDAFLAGEKYDPKNSISNVGDVPDQFKSWVRDNKNRVKGWKSTPNFITDNLNKDLQFKPGRIVPSAPNFKKVVPKPPPPIEAPAVAKAFDDIQPGVRASVLKALGLIDKVHGDGVLPKIPIKTSSSTQFSGCYTQRSYGGKRVGEKISIVKGGDHEVFTMLHETGHFLDHYAFGETWHFDSVIGSKVTKIMEAAKSTKAIKELRRVKATGILEVKGTYKHLNKTGERAVKYYLQDPEIFARAYSQYIVQKTMDPTAMGQLAREIKESLLPIQWQKEDFVPLMQEFDALFKELGWLR